MLHFKEHLSLPLHWFLSFYFVKNVGLFDAIASELRSLGSLLFSILMKNN